MIPIAWIASYPKSGNTWTRTMLASYLAEGRLESVTELDDLVPDFGRYLGQGRMVPTESPRPLVLKTHFLPTVDLMQLYRERTNKVVYLVRNPRDVILSTIRHLNIREGQVGEFAKHFIEHRGVQNWREGWGNWVESVEEWTGPQSVQRAFPGARVLVVRYEDLREDPAVKLYEMVDFLGFDRTPDEALVRKAVENTSLERLREAEKVERGKGLSAFRDGPKNAFFGTGLRNQSLAGLGDDVEEAYLRAVKEDPAFAACLDRFGYEA